MNSNKLYNVDIINNSLTDQLRNSNSWIDLTIPKWLKNFNQIFIVIITSLVVNID